MYELRSNCITWNDRASSSYYSSVVKVLSSSKGQILLPAASLHQQTRQKLPMTLFCRTSSACLIVAFSLLSICFGKRNLQRTWEHYCNHTLFPCQGLFQNLRTGDCSHRFHLQARLLVNSGIGFSRICRWGRDRGCIYATRSDYTLRFVAVKG